MATIGQCLPKHQILRQIIKTLNHKHHTCCPLLLTTTRRLHTSVQACATKRKLNSINPLLDVQAYTQETLFKDTDKIFSPTKEEIAEAEKLFTPTRKHRIQFLKGAYHPFQAPEYSLPEVGLQTV